MYTVVHPLVETHTGEAVRLVFTVTDQAGTAVSLSGASAIYKIARHAGDAALLVKTETAGIALSGNTATVSFNTSELTSGGAALLGDFFAQLQVTKSGDSLIVAEGPLSVAPVIA